MIWVKRGEDSRAAWANRLIQVKKADMKPRDRGLLLSVDRDVATFEVEGKRVTVGLGQARAPARRSAVNALRR